MSHVAAAQRELPVDIDSGRLIGRIDALAQIGAGAGGGITREGFSAADLQARSYVMSQARASGLTAAVDAAGNVLVRPRPAASRPPGGKALLIGSHLDTVVNAGRLDGAYGVLAALEVLQVFAEAGLHPEHEPVAVAFANEEGALFPQPFWGSMVLAGRLAELPGEPRDHHGRPLRGPLSQAGGDLDALRSAVWPAGSVTAYLELHVEQGPVLERSHDRIGIVDAISGRTVLTVEVRGTAGHAGTTPMDGRRDAVAAAARVALATESISREHGTCRAATVGRFDAYPNTPNTIAQTVRMTADLRDTDARRLAAAEASLRDALRAVAGQTGTEIDVVGEVRSEPVATCPALRRTIESCAGRLGLPHQVLPSGAGHDAQIMATVAPVGMIFVPSIGGVSHVPGEDTASEDLAAGARVLLHTAAQVAGVARSGPAAASAPGWRQR